MRSRNQAFFASLKFSSSGFEIYLSNHCTNIHPGLKATRASQKVSENEPRIAEKSKTVEICSQRFIRIIILTEASRLFCLVRQVIQNSHFIFTHGFVDDQRDDENACHTDRQTRQHKLRAQ